MRRFTIAALSLLLLSFSLQAEESLLLSDCGIISESQLEPNGLVILATTSTLPGMSCETAKAVISATEVVNLVVMPAMLVLKTPGLREELATELVTMGLSLSNPAILGVTVLGAFGYVTVYFVLKSTIQQCENARVQEMIRSEVESRLRLKTAVPITIRR